MLDQLRLRWQTLTGYQRALYGVLGLLFLFATIGWVAGIATAFGRIATPGNPGTPPVSIPFPTVQATATITTTPQPTATLPPTPTQSRRGRSSSRLHLP
jgi:hypothetical protein